MNIWSFDYELNTINYSYFFFENELFYTFDIETNYFAITDCETIVTAKQSIANNQK